ncbi:hypothetical protein CF70_031870 [Cupriavidus sp. SK-3]|nr:hypothetical protein CF70_031870 [Cupriavidus sp. SK-3]
MVRLAVETGAGLPKRVALCIGAIDVHAEARASNESASVRRRASLVFMISSIWGFANAPPI